MLRILAVAAVVLELSDAGAAATAGFITNTWASDLPERAELLKHYVMLDIGFVVAPRSRPWE